MIDFDKLKMVLWDFDDTLCIHRHHNIDVNNLVKNIVLHGMSAYTDDEYFTSSYLRSFMMKCSNSGIRQGLISFTRSSREAKAKLDWVEDKYGFELEDFCVNSLEGKVDMMSIIADAYQYNRDEILIVDDMYHSLSKAEREGFQSCSPSEILSLLFNGECCHV